MSVGRLGYGWVVLVSLSAMAWPGMAECQQVGDPDFTPHLSAPAFPLGEGPRVVIDEGHFNFHTLAGRFQTFARVLRSDGFVVDGIRGPFTRAALTQANLLVIANALHEQNVGGRNWRLPTPSAFSDDEIEAVRSWVEGGGALLLIADHMPFPGAAADLAGSFGFELSNGFAMDTTTTGPLVFRRADGSLGAHPITTGQGAGERIDSVATFTGEAFRAPAAATAVLTLPAGYVSLLSEVAWEFGPGTRSVDVAGWSQGSVLEYGAGRVAVFGEAAMFTAQRSGPQAAPMGMNAPVASQNPQFVANLVRWLTHAR